MHKPQGITCRGKRRKITRSLRLLGQALCLESCDFSCLTLAGSPERNTLLLSLWQRPLVRPISVTPSLLGFTVGQHHLFLHDSTCGFRVIWVPTELRGYELDCLLLSLSLSLSGQDKDPASEMHHGRSLGSCRGHRAELLPGDPIQLDQERKKLLWD